jgi:hypothetical protein
MADKGGAFRFALRIDEDRQVAADAERVHVVEEVRAMTAEEILHIVFRRCHEDIDAGLVHQPIETIGVEWNLRPKVGRFRGSEHGAGSLGKTRFGRRCRRIAIPPVLGHGRVWNGYFFSTVFTTSCATRTRMGSGRSTS